MKKIILLLSLMVGVLMGNDLTPVSLQLKWKYQFQFAGFIMAKEKGFYKDVGLDVNLIEFDETINVYDRVEHGDVHFGVGDSSLVYMFMQERPFVALMAIFQESLFLLVSLKSSGIEKLEDIEGKRIAMDNLTGIAIGAMLKSRNINYTVIDPKYQVDALFNQEIDMMTAYVSNEVYHASQQGIELNLFKPRAYGFGGYGDILFTSMNMMRDNEETVKNFYSATDKGWKYAFEHMDEAVELIYAQYNSLNKTREALLYEAQALRELSGYGKNFGELNHHRIQGIARMFSLMNHGNYNNEDFMGHIYCHDYIKYHPWYKKFRTYIDNMDPFVFWAVVWGTLSLIVYTIVWVTILRLKNRKLSKLFDKSIAAMGIFEHGKLIDVNKVAIDEFGYTKEEALGMTFFDFIDEEYHHIFYTKLKSSEENYELLLKRKDGTRFWGYLRGVMLNEYTRISNVINIDELKHAQSELETLNQDLQMRVAEEVEKSRHEELMMAKQSRMAQIGQVISMIAHQWRQPLNNLSLLNQQIHIFYDHGKLDSQRMHNFQEGTQKQIKQMSDTINDFSNFFKPDKEKSTFNLMQIVKDTVEVMEPILKQNHIEIDTFIEPGVKLLLEGYPSELRQALINIVNNAKDALLDKESRSDKWIHIRLYSKGENTFLEVEDNAGGVPEETLERIFDPYFSTKLQKHGTGLGLYVAKMIVEEHEKGRLMMKNGEQGAIFTMAFQAAH